MKYWFFDGNDVVGPFTPQELAARADFSVASSLVCPENFSEDGDSWKTAASFTDFGPDALSSGSAVSGDAAEPAAPEPDASSDEEAALFDKEMDTFLKNPSILAGTAAPAPEGPALEIPKKPAKPGPIEDYFNNINGEDLGDILGIPDPNENSDMNLPRVVDGHFEHTASPSDKEIDSVEDDVDEDEAAAEEAPEPPLPPQQEETPPASPLAPAPPVKQPLPEMNAVKREDPVLSVPISAAEEELCVVLPGKSAAEAAPADIPAAPEPPLPPQKEELPAAPVPPAAPEEKEAAPAAAAPEESAAADSDGETVPAEEANAQTAPETEPSAQEAQGEPREEKTVCSSAPLEEEKLSTCTLPLIGERENAVSLPTMPEDGVPFVPPEPAAADFAPQEKETPAEQAVATAEEKPSEPEISAPEEPSAPAEPEELVPASGPAEAAEEEDPKTQTVRDILRGELSLPPGPEELKEPLKTVPVEPSLNQVKTKLKQTPEIEQFLTTQSQIVRRSRNRKANLMLWVLAALLAVGVIFMSLRYLGRPTAEPENPAREAEKTVSVPRDISPARASSAAPAVPAASRSALETPVPPPAPLSASDKALAAVQNHQLPGGKGTVASYFDRIYKTQLTQGYTGDWSAEALHKNTYIVKYRLSKTRMEPIVYVFQADAARGKLTGALNNVALDLVGKI